jgi:hypothetical protein
LEHQNNPAAHSLISSTTSPSPAAKKVAKKKRILSPEGRQRIAEAVKKRWAAKKAAATK